MGRHSRRSSRRSSSRRSLQSRLRSVYAPNQSSLQHFLSAQVGTFSYVPPVQVQQPQFNYGYNAGSIRRVAPISTLRTYVPQGYGAAPAFDGQFVGAPVVGDVAASAPIVQDAGVTYDQGFTGYQGGFTQGGFTQGYAQPAGFGGYGYGAPVSGFQGGFY